MLSLLTSAFAVMQCTDVQNLFNAYGCCSESADAHIPLTVPGEVNHMLITYRTGPYSANGNAFANGMRAGIEQYGHIVDQRQRTLTVNVHECESGYNTGSGVRCMYNSTGQYVSMSTLSTSIAAAAESVSQILGISQILSGYGNQALAAQPIENTFTTGPTYSDAVATFLQSVPPSGILGYIGHGFNGGFSTYGAAPLQGLNEHQGTLHTHSCDHPCVNRSVIDPLVQDLKSKNVVAIYVHPWGAMTNAVLQSCKDHGVLDKVTTVWWGQSHDTTLDFVGVKAVAMTTTSNTPMPYTPGYSPSVFAQGVRESVVASEAIRSYVNRHQDKFHYQYTSSGVTYDVYPELTFTPNMMTEALTELNITTARLAELGLADFMEPCKVTETDHTQCGGTKYVQWDAPGQWALL